jgi:hypothetical protein
MNELEIAAGIVARSDRARRADEYVVSRSLFTMIVIMPSSRPRWPRHFSTASSAGAKFSRDLLPFRLAVNPELKENL